MQVENGLLSSFSVIRFLFSSHTHYCIKSKTFFCWECCVAFQTNTKLSFILWLIRRLCSCCRLLKRICWFPLWVFVSFQWCMCLFAIICSFFALLYASKMAAYVVQKHKKIYCFVLYLSFHFRVLTWRVSSLIGQVYQLLCCVKCFRLFLFHMITIEFCVYQNRLRM